MHPKIYNEMYLKHYVPKKLCIQITINLTFYLFVYIYISFFGPLLMLMFFSFIWPIWLCFCLSSFLWPFNCSSTSFWILHSHKWIYGTMHNWRSKGCKKDVSQVKGKNTIRLKGSTPNHGFIAFEHRCNSLQSSIFM